jgi:hypothetical protein
MTNQELKDRLDAQMRYQRTMYDEEEQQELNAFLTLANALSPEERTELISYFRMFSQTQLTFRNGLPEMPDDEKLVLN